MILDNHAMHKSTCSIYVRRRSYDLHRKYNICSFPANPSKYKNNYLRKVKFQKVGGSLGGLATGIALSSPPLSHKVTILERNPTKLLHNQGAGIVAGGDTLSFFKRYDRCERPIAVSSQRRQYLDKEGNVVHKEDMVQNMTSWDLAYYLMRANFDGVESRLLQSPPKRGGSRRGGTSAWAQSHRVKR